MLCERLEGLVQLLGQCRRGVSVVMEMNLDFAEALLHEAGELVHEVRAIFFAGKEEAVARRAAVRIAELAERRIAFDPRVDARHAGRIIGVSMEWFVVIAEREQQVRITARARGTSSPRDVARVVRQPLVEVLLAKSGKHGSARG